MTDDRPIAPPTRTTRRADWHRVATLAPIAYLVAIVAVGFAHPVLPGSEWLLIHLLLLGAATNAILVWSAHFATAILRTPAPATRRGEAARLLLLNTGVVAVLLGGSVGPAWLGVAGAALVFAAIAAHLAVLATRLRRALPARFEITVHYYLAAGIALLTGVPAGAWMLLIDDDQRSRLLLFHAHVNLLGWVTLTVLGTLLTLWPTVLRTRMVPSAHRAAVRALRLGVAGLVAVSAGVLAWWPPLAAAGFAAYAAAVVLVVLPGIATARQQRPQSFAAWSIAAAMGWLVIAIGCDGVELLRAPDAAAAADGLDTVVVPFVVGFVAQVLTGSLSYLLPMVLGGGPHRVRERTARLDRHWPQRVTMANLALVVYLLPVPAFVRIAAAMLILGALLQFLVPVVRILLPQRGKPAPPPAGDPNAGDPPAGVLTAGVLTAWSPPAVRPAGGIAAGIALVLVAVLVGVLAQHASDPRPDSTAAVPATGHTTVVDVTASGMRYHPDHIAVTAGDRLVIVLTNTDTRRHDLVLSNGARTELLSHGQSVRLDAGIVGAAIQGWCSQPGHRQAGMVLTITGTGQPSPVNSSGNPMMHPTVDSMVDPGPAFIARDASAPPAPAGNVHRITLHAQEGMPDVAAGVRQTMWTFNGTAPGPLLRGRVGDTFEVTLVNDGGVEHGIDFHAEALAPDTAMRTVEPGERTTYRFTASKAGIWMYHCSAMPMLFHVGNGMFGALIIDPPDLAAVDREYLLVQSELYLGADGQLGDLARMRADQPDAVAFNGYVAQYAWRPLPARAGQRVRIWLLDAGPNRNSAFHVVGVPFDTVYAEGGYRLRTSDPGGAQVLDLAPASGGFVEMSFRQPGAYPFLTHVLADAERGARGTVQVTS